MAEANYQFSVGSEVYFVEYSVPMKGVVEKVFIVAESDDSVKYKVAANNGEYIVPESGLFAAKEELVEHLTAGVANIDNNETTEE